MAERNYVRGKVIVVTGAAGGFGRLVCEKTAASAKVVCGDIDAPRSRPREGAHARGADAMAATTSRASSSARAARRSSASAAST